MMKFNILPLTIAALSVAISLDSTQAFSLTSYVTQNRFLREHVLEAAAERDAPGGAPSVITGGGGSDDSIDGGGSDDSIDGVLSDDSIDGGLSDDNISNDSIDGGGSDDSIDGGGSDDSIDSGLNDDSIDGGLNDDSVDGGLSDDSIDGGLSDDSIDGGLSDDTVGTGDDETDGDDPCANNGNGNFGNISNDEVSIEYDYEMVTNENTNVAATLSQLEDKIASLVLGSTYVTCLERRWIRRKLALTGLSSNPEDESTGVECSSAQYIGSEQCDVVKGGLTLYVDGNVQSHTDGIKQVIQDGMNDGLLASKIENIVQLIYLIPDEAALNENQAGDDQEERQRTTRGSNYVGLFSAGASCAAVLLGFLAVKRMMKKDVEPENTEDSESIHVHQADESIDEVSAAGNGSHLNSTGSVTVTSFAQQSFGAL